jgi:3-hydroxypropanoate dehydrogenase
MSSPVTSEQTVLTPEAQRLLFTEARTASAFLPEPVTDEQLEVIFELSKFGPTMANTNPLRWVVVRTPEAKERLLPLMSEGNRLKVESAPAVVILAADVDFHVHGETLFPHKPQMHAGFADNPNRELLARNNAWLQTGYFILAVRAAGLAAGPMGGFDAAGVDAEFLAGTSLKSIVVVNVGRPAAEGAWFERLPRLEREQVVREA